MLLQKSQKPTIVMHPSNNGSVINLPGPGQVGSGSTTPATTVADRNQHNYSYLAGQLSTMLYGTQQTEVR